MRAVVAALTLIALPLSAAVRANDDPAIQRGAYLVDAAGCVACHTADNEGAKPLAGGRALETPFGTFFSPNITPDPRTGIGAWTQEEWRAALREGISPEGRHYYPSFPYTSYTGISDADLRDMKAYLDSRTPVHNEVPQHQLGFPFNQRWLMGPWKWLFFTPGSSAETATRSARWQRGEYLVNALGHCGECHTPRNLLGAVDNARYLQGNDEGPEGEAVPSISRRNGGLLDWQSEDLVLGLQIGMNTEGDFFSGSMAEVVEHATSKLSEEDLRAIATYLLDAE